MHPPVFVSQVSLAVLATCSEVHVREVAGVAVGVCCSRDASGVVRGRLDIEVAAKASSLDELLADPEKPAEDGEVDED